MAGTLEAYHGCCNCRRAKAEGNFNGVPPVDRILNPRPGEPSFGLNVLCRPTLEAWSVRAARIEI